MMTHRNVFKRDLDQMKEGSLAMSGLDLLDWYLVARQNSLALERWNSHFLGQFFVSCLNLM